MRTFLAFIAVLLLTSACSSKRIMRDCKPLAQSYYECETP